MSDPLRLEEAVQQFLRAKRIEGTERSVPDYESILRRFVAAFPFTELQSFEQREATETLREFIELGWSETTTGTQAKVISVLKTFFAWCYQQDLIERDPAVKLRRPPRESIARRPQDPEVVTRVIDAQPSRARDLGQRLKVPPAGEGLDSPQHCALGRHEAP